MKALTRRIPGSIATKGSGASASDKPPHKAPQPVRQTKKAVPFEERDVENIETLNFRVLPEFKREFKIYAASHDMKMNDLLRRSFQAYRKHHGD
jgi:hypothetical protein